MKKLISIIIMCSFAVVVYLKDGTTIRADRVVRYMPNAIVVEIVDTDEAKLVNLDTTRIYIPNINIKRVIQK